MAHRCACVTWRRLNSVVKNYEIIARYNGKPASGIGVKLATGANALDTAKAVKDELAKLQPFFPAGMKNRLPVRHHAVREDLDL